MFLCTLLSCYFCCCFSICRNDFPLSFSFPAMQRSVCSPRADGRRVCVQTPTADSSPSLSTISMRCSRSTPWCGALSRLSPSTDWTALVRPAYSIFLSCSDWSNLLPVIVPCCLVFISICLPFFHHKSIVSAILCCMTCMLFCSCFILSLFRF